MTKKSFYNEFCVLISRFVFSYIQGYGNVPFRCTQKLLASTFSTAAVVIKLLV
jgi:hypothetical protein